MRRRRRFSFFFSVTIVILFCLVPHFSGRNGRCLFILLRELVPHMGPVPSLCAHRKERTTRFLSLPPRRPSPVTPLPRPPPTHRRRSDRGMHRLRASALGDELLGRLWHRRLDRRSGRPGEARGRLPAAAGGGRRVDAELLKVGRKHVQTRQRMAAGPARPGVLRQRPRRRAQVLDDVVEEGLLGLWCARRPHVDPLLHAVLSVEAAGAGAGRLHRHRVGRGVVAGDADARRVGWPRWGKGEGSKGFQES